MDVRNSGKELFKQVLNENEDVVFLTQEKIQKTPLAGAKRPSTGQVSSPKWPLQSPADEGDETPGSLHFI